MYTILGGKGSLLSTINGAEKLGAIKGYKLRLFMIRKFLFLTK